MELAVQGRAAFAYTAAHDLDPAQAHDRVRARRGPGPFLVGPAEPLLRLPRLQRAGAWTCRRMGAPKAPPLATIGEMADWVKKVLDEKKIKSAAVVGHSMGSLIALEFAARYPERAEKIALIGVAYPMKVSDGFLDAARRNDQAAYDMETIWGHARAGAARGQSESGHVDVRRHAGAPRAPRARRAAHRPFRLQRLCGRHGGGGESEVPGALHPRRARHDDAAARARRIWPRRSRVRRPSRIAPSGHSLMAEAPDATLDALIAFLA